MELFPAVRYIFFCFQVFSSERHLVKNKKRMPLPSGLWVSTRIEDLSTNRTSTDIKNYKII